jgi:hypothetical protein
MPVSGGGFEQSYNAQAAVDTHTMLVIDTHVSQAPVPGIARRNAGAMRHPHLPSCPPISYVDTILHQSQPAFKTGSPRAYGKAGFPQYSGRLGLICQISRSSST